MSDHARFDARFDRPLWFVGALVVAYGVAITALLSVGAVALWHRLH